MVADINPERDRDGLTILECLEETMKDFKAGEVPMKSGNRPTNVVVMFLDDSPGRFETKVLCGSDTDKTMRSSTLVSLMELYKYICLKAMNDE